MNPITTTPTTSRINSTYQWSSSELPDNDKFSQSGTRFGDHSRVADKWKPWFSSRETCNFDVNRYVLMCPHAHTHPDFLFYLLYYRARLLFTQWVFRIKWQCKLWFLIFDFWKHNIPLLDLELQLHFFCQFLTHCVFFC